MSARSFVSSCMLLVVVALVSAQPAFAAQPRRGTSRRLAQFQADIKPNDFSSANRITPTVTQAPPGQIIKAATPAKESAPAPALVTEPPLDLPAGSRKEAAFAEDRSQIRYVSFGQYGEFNEFYTAPKAGRKMAL